MSTSWSILKNTQIQSRIKATSILQKAGFSWNSSKNISFWLGIVWVDVETVNFIWGLVEQILRGSLVVSAQLLVLLMWFTSQNYLRIEKVGSIHACPQRWFFEARVHSQARIKKTDPCQHEIKNSKGFCLLATAWYLTMKISGIIINSTPEQWQKPFSKNTLCLGCVFPAPP